MVERVEGRQTSLSAQTKKLVKRVRRTSVKRVAMIVIYGR